MIYCSTHVIRNITDALYTWPLIRNGDGCYELGFTQIMNKRNIKCLYIYTRETSVMTPLSCFSMELFKVPLLEPLMSRTVKRVKYAGTLDDSHWKGRTRVTSRRQARFIRLSYLRDRFLTPMDTDMRTPETHNNRITRDNVLRCHTEPITGYR